MGYEALIPLAAFFVALQLATRTNAHPAVSATVAVLIPYAVTLITNYIRAVGYNLPILPSLFSLASIVTVVIQFVLSLYIFKKVRDEDGIAATMAWGLGGFIVVVLVVPFLVGQIIL